jgi:hypothetical protein
MWEFISVIKPPQKMETDEDQISYCHKYLESLYYLYKWVFKMNISCLNFSLTSTEKNWASKKFAGPLEIKSQ